MITGMHAIIYSADAEADRAFIRDTFGFAHIDNGGGWLIFQLPPAEVAVHPGGSGHELFLMCDDIEATAADLRGKGVTITEGPVERRYGIEVVLALPGGGTLRVYEPRHAIAKDL